MNLYTLAPLAESDLDDIWFFIAGEAGLNTADRLVDAITQRLLMLAEYPEAGRARHNDAAAWLRADAGGRT